MSDQPAPGGVPVSGPLARFADGFRVDLTERGYLLWPAQEQLYLLAHVSRCMEAEGLELAVFSKSVGSRPERSSCMSRPRDCFVRALRAAG